VSPDAYILVVDDDDDVREILAAILRDHGSVVVTAKDGVDAIGVLHGASTPPHLIILDIQMPRMDGHELLAWLRAQSAFARVPVCMITASEVQCVDGAQHLVSKPIDMDALLHVVRSHSMGASARAAKLPPAEPSIQSVMRVTRGAARIAASEEAIKKHSKPASRVAA
jgi:DNA-binding response OmpR family regulator